MEWELEFVARFIQGKDAYRLPSMVVRVLEHPQENRNVLLPCEARLFNMGHLIILRLFSIHPPHTALQLSMVRV